jgi:hypothetical protein
MKTIRKSLLVSVAVTYLSASPVSAECMGSVPRFVEMEVENCSSAQPLARASIEGKQYPEWDANTVEFLAGYLFVVRARQLAYVDLIDWFSHGNMHHYRGPRDAIEGDAARDYVVIAAYGGCKQLLEPRVHLFDVNPEKPCRDMGPVSRETEPRLLITLPEAALIDEEGTEDLSRADDFFKRVSPPAR